MSVAFGGLDHRKVIPFLIPLGAYLSRFLRTCAYGR